MLVFTSENIKMVIIKSLCVQPLFLSVQISSYGVGQDTFVQSLGLSSSTLKCIRRGAWDKVCTDIINVTIKYPNHSIISLLTNQEKLLECMTTEFELPHGNLNSNSHYRNSGRYQLRRLLLKVDRSSFSSNFFYITTLDINFNDFFIHIKTNNEHSITQLAI